MKRRLGLHRAASTKHEYHARKAFRVSTGGPRAPGIMRIRATYVDPDAPLSLIQLKNLVLWRRTT